MIPRHDGGRDDIDTWPGEEVHRSYSPPARRVCGTCKGKGTRRIARSEVPCETCDGTGRIPDKGSRKCPICGSDSWTFTMDQGYKWGRAVCGGCDCAGPEVRTFYDRSEEAEWHRDAVEAFRRVVLIEKAVKGHEST